MIFTARCYAVGHLSVCLTHAGIVSQRLNI